MWSWQARFTSVFLSDWFTSPAVLCHCSPQNNFLIFVFNQHQCYLLLHVATLLPREKTLLKSQSECTCLWLDSLFSECNAHVHRSQYLVPHFSLPQWLRLQFTKKQTQGAVYKEADSGRSLQRNRLHTAMSDGNANKLQILILLKVKRWLSHTDASQMVMTRSRASQPVAWQDTSIWHVQHWWMSPSTLFTLHWHNQCSLVHKAQDHSPISPLTQLYHYVIPISPLTQLYHHETPISPLKELYR